MVAAALTANYGKQLDSSDRNGGPPNLLLAGALRSARGRPDDNRAQAGHLVVEGDSAASTPDLPRLRAGCGRAGEAAVLAHTLRGEGHDASEDGTGRGTPIVATYQASDYQQGTYEEADTARPLTTSADRTRSAPIAFAVNQHREGRPSEVHGSLHEPSGTQVDGVLAIQDGRAMDKAQNGRGWNDEGVGYTLDGTGAQSVVAAVPRRLTPRECERLQAFPDDWTRYDSDGREIADSPRYRMLGNAVTVNVAEWIGCRIMAAHEAIQ